MEGPEQTHPNPVVEYCHPPDLPDLDIKANVTVKRGPDQLPTEVWICGNREAHENGEDVHNQPTNNFLLRLPPISCTGCGRLNPAGYVWSIINCTLNDIELDLLARDQGDHDTCVAHAILAAMDLMRRIAGAVAHGAMVCHPLDMDDIFRKFLARFRTAFSYEEDTAYNLRELRIQCILNIAQADGVGYEAPALRSPGRAPSALVLRMGDAFNLGPRNVEYIIRLLAGGHPLVACIGTGRTFRYVGAGEIYDGATLSPNHCVVLIGSGVAHWPGNPTDHNKAALKNWPRHPANNRPRGHRLFFRARGSYGERSHPEYARVAMGADFDIWVDEVVGSVWGFHLA